MLADGDITRHLWLHILDELMAALLPELATSEEPWGALGAKNTAAAT